MRGDFGMDIESVPITELIPHRAPFIMVDKVVEWGDTYVLTTFMVGEDNVFLDHGELQAEGIIENMAQSCAALMGCHGIRDCGTPNNHYIGIVAQISGCKIESRPLLHDVLSTRALITESIFNMFKLEVTVTVAGRAIAVGQLKLAVMPE